jgi:predicted small lipoprotein YifL
MKKLFAVAALVTLAACTREKPAPETPAADSVTVAPAADTTMAPKADSTMARDTAKTM